MFQNTLGLAILENDYDNLHEDAASYLEEESLDQLPEATKAYLAGKKARKSSFYLKKLSLAEVRALLSSQSNLLSDYYSRQLIDTSTNFQNRDIFERIVVYTDLLMESDGFSFRRIDSKNIQKKIKLASNFSSSGEGIKSQLHQNYERVALGLRSRLFTDILAKCKAADHGEGAKNNDPFKQFFIKVAMYVLAGIEIGSYSSSVVAKALQSLISHPDKSKTEGETQISEEKGHNREIERPLPLGHQDEDEKEGSDVQYGKSATISTIGVNDEHSKLLDEKGVSDSDSKLKSDLFKENFSLKPRIFIKKMTKEGAWIDETLFSSLIEITPSFCQFKNIEEYLMTASTPSIQFSKDLLYGATVSKDFKPQLFLILYHMIRVALIYFEQQKSQSSMDYVLHATECMFLNLMIMSEILRKTYMQDKARVVEAVQLCLLWTLADPVTNPGLLASNAPEIDLLRAKVQTRNNMMRVVFRTYLTKLDFKVSKNTNSDYLLQSCEATVDKPLFAFSAELLERKFKLIEESVGLPETLLRQLAADDSPVSQDSPPQPLFAKANSLSGQNTALAQDLILHIQAEVSKLYTAEDILNSLRFRANSQIMAAVEVGERLLSISDVMQAYRMLKTKITESVLELAFKIESLQAAIETDIGQHDERYERILSYLKNKIEVSGISSESVMRSCRFAAQKMCKEQRDVNGFWAARDMQAFLQVDSLFDPGHFDYDEMERNKYYDFAVENYCTAQKTRPFLRFELRRYWSDNYDDVFKDEDKDGAKSVYTALNSRSGKAKKGRRKETVSQVKQTGFFLFQVKKNRHKSRFRHRLLNASGQDVGDLDKLFTESSENEQMVFGKRCQLIEKFKIWKGSLYLYRDKLYFYINTFEISNYFSSQTKELKSFDKLKRMWNISSIKDMKIRRLNQRRSAIELFFKDGHSIYINFNACKPAEKDVAAFYQKLKSVISLSNPKLDPTKLMYFVPSKQFDALRLTERWLHGELSNFEYLMEVNLSSGRSYNDLSQYPIYPWVLMVDFTTDLKAIDFFDGDIDSFLSQIKMRDLSNNIGSIGDPTRLKNYVKRFTSARYFDSHVPPYHYGSHYSTPAIVIYFLLRLFPFTEGAIDFQSGSFDIADRLFHSIQKCFKNAMEEMSDVRELLPEFFYLPELLLNINKLNLGFMHTEERVHNVELPEWSNQNPYIFCYVMRKLLECKDVSTSLGSWIDLVFGSKQTGPEAIEKTNIFYYLTYEGQVDMDELPEEDKDAIETQVLHFGQTPSQLFPKEHPSLKESNPRFLFSLSKEKQRMMMYKRTKLDSLSQDQSAPIKSIWLNAAYNQKLFVSAIKGTAIDTYLWETKTAKDMTATNSIPFRLAHSGEVLFSDYLNCDATDLLDRSLFEKGDSPFVLAPDKKLLILGGYISGAVNDVYSGQSVQFKQEEGQRLRDPYQDCPKNLYKSQPDLLCDGVSRRSRGVVEGRRHRAVSERPILRIQRAGDGPEHEQGPLEPAGRGGRRRQGRGLQHGEQNHPPHDVPARPRRSQPGLSVALPSREHRDGVQGHELDPHLQCERPAAGLLLALGKDRAGRHRHRRLLLRFLGKIESSRWSRRPRTASWWAICPSLRTGRPTTWRATWAARG
jgi:hypothetical protein